MKSDKSRRSVEDEWARFDRKSRFPIEDLDTGELRILLTTNALHECWINMKYYARKLICVFVKCKQD